MLQYRNAAAALASELDWHAGYRKPTKKWAQEGTPLSDAVEAGDKSNPSSTEERVQV